MDKGIATYPPAELTQLLEAAQGHITVDLLIRNVHYLDVFTGVFRLGEVAIHRSMIVGVGEHYAAHEVLEGNQAYLVPGFIDSHVHIESSLLSPAQFERMVLPRGTTAVIWDPHEIANVKGKDGIEWALDESEDLQLDVFVMLPSCVPAAGVNKNLESATHILDADALAEYAEHPRVLGLGEVMDYPNALGAEPDMLQKLRDFAHLKIDGHCPKLSGKMLSAYAMLGIHSCHESSTRQEAEEKLSKGIHVLVREGSCAKDAKALLGLLNPMTSTEIGFCSDDRNPIDVAEEGHIDAIIKQALMQGIAPEVVFRAASYAPAKLYGLHDRGAIAPGYLADMVLLSPEGAWRRGMRIVSVFKSGKRIEVSHLGGRRQAHYFSSKNIQMPICTLDDIQVQAKSKGRRQSVRVIGLKPQSLITESLEAQLVVIDKAVQLDITQDVLKLVVLERHRNTGQRGVGFVKGFNLKQGAIASTISHDAHNMVVVGADDQLMLMAIKHLREIDGGIVVINGQGKVEALPLPIAGLMSDSLPEDVALQLSKLKKMVTQLGCSLKEPFLQLSFLSLPVIPALKLTDQGLVDTVAFKKVEVCV